MTTTSDGFTLQDWAHGEIETYDERSYFEENITPLIRQVEALCGARNIPFTFVAATGQDGTAAACYRAGALYKMERVTNRVLLAHLACGSEQGMRLREILGELLEGIECAAERERRLILLASAATPAVAN